MKITTGEDGGLVIGEVFSGAYIETAEGNRIGFCLRDDTIEFNVLPKGSKEHRWHRVNMQTLEVEAMVERNHVLGCDEYHQHVAPKCCSSTCWCLEGHAGDPSE